MHKKSLFAHFALWGALLVPSAVNAKDVVLITVYSDDKKEVPLESAFYYVYRGGTVVDSGFTGADGRVLYSAAPGEAINDGYFVVDRIGEFAFTMDSHQKVDLKFLGRTYISGAVSSCNDKKGECTGKGFYAIQLRGIGTRFKNEPYDIVVNGAHTQGVVSDEGYIFLPFADPPTKTNATVTFCEKAVAKVTMGRQMYQSSVKWTGGGSSSGLECSKSRLKGYIAKNRAYNNGFPLLMASWSPGMTPDQQEEAEEQEKQAAQNNYAEMAEANDDLLHWLGPLPRVWSDKEFSARQAKLSAQIMADVRALPNDWRRSFKCKKPEDVGAVPNMADVNAFLEKFPASIQSDKFQLLVDAAKLGNWLARLQLYVISNQFELVEEPRVKAYRNLQLAEWLQARKIGGLYREFGQLLLASGYYSDAPEVQVTSLDIFAALHHSYPAQYSVGSQLRRSPEAEDRELGQRMMDCAVSALPAYKTLLTKPR